MGCDPILSDSIVLQCCCRIIHQAVKILNIDIYFSQKKRKKIYILHLYKYINLNSFKFLVTTFALLMGMQQN